VNVLAEAERMLGDTELTPGQLAQLRALSRKYNQLLYESRGRDGELRERLRADVLAMLTPAQRRKLEGA
jgi:Spy/CpxP family protein refolding chaperone